MKLEPLDLDGVFGIASKPFFDERGSFIRIWETDSLFSHLKLAEASAATNLHRRTLRGLHYQVNPHAETKVIQCISGEVFDVLVDMRANSDTYREHISVLLGPHQSYQGLLVPAGFAHGYLTLKANSTLLYFMDKPYVAEAARGIRWNDPLLQIQWPLEPEVISLRDTSLPLMDIS